ncbi:MAG: hypothetical protein ACFFAY_16075, partial [Promethearchaeota archaeon]
IFSLGGRYEIIAIEAIAMTTTTATAATMSFGSLLSGYSDIADTTILISKLYNKVIGWNLDI